MRDRLNELARYARQSTLEAAGRGGKALADSALQLHVLVDAFVDEAQKLPAEPKAACHPKCCACCHGLIVASGPEILAAANHVRKSFNTEQIESFLARIDENEAANADFWAERTSYTSAPCAFLADGLCQIYEARPISCRARNAVDPASCAAAYLYGEQAPFPLNRTQAMVSGVGQVVSTACRDVGITGGGLEFGPAVAAVLRRAEIAENLGAFTPEFERVKLASEWWAKEQKTPESVVSTHAKPENREVYDLVRSGHVEDAWSRLERLPPSPFRSIFKLIFPTEYRSEAEIEEWWDRFDRSLTDIENEPSWTPELFQLMQLQNTFGLAYTGKDCRSYLERLMHVLCDGAAKLHPQYTAPIEGVRKPGKFRLGYISAQIKSFNGSRWALGWLRNHSEDIETYVIHAGEQEDRTSQAFRRAADNYLHLPLLTEDIARIVRGLDLDALFFTDVGMTGRTVQLASLRLARKQFNCWGHPVTSGSPQMDFYLSAALMQPPNGQDHFSERLVLLPGTGVTSPRRALAPSQKSASELGVPEDGFLLYCQMPNKHLPQWDFLFERIASSGKKPIVFIHGPPSYYGEGLDRRLCKLGSRAIFLPFQPFSDYLRILQLADASLDSPAFSGGFTAVDALGLGTPIVTMPGEFMRGRLSLAFLETACVGGLVAKTADDYVDLATNEERRRAATKGMQLDPLFEDTAPVRFIDDVLLNNQNR